MSHIQVVIVTESDELAKRCEEALSREKDFQLNWLKSIPEFQKWVLGKGVSGLLIDMKALVRAPIQDRNFINELAEGLIVGKIRIVPETGEIAGNLGPQNLAGAEFFDYLIKAARVVPPNRKIRQFERRTRILNVTISLPADIREEPFQSNTVDVSEGGLFFISPRSFSPGTPLRIEILEFPECPPFEAYARWCLKWGKSSSHYPGIGVQFSSTTEQQHQRILGLLGQSAAELAAQELAQGIKRDIP